MDQTPSSSRAWTSRLKAGGLLALLAAGGYTAFHVHDQRQRRTDVVLREAQIRVMEAQFEYYRQHGRVAQAPEALDSLILVLMSRGGRELGFLTREEMNLQIAEASDSAFRFSMQHRGKTRSCSVRVDQETLCAVE